MSAAAQVTARARRARAAARCLFGHFVVWYLPCRACRAVGRSGEEQ